MFIKIGEVNYFILDAKKKSIQMIYDEIFTRSSMSKVTPREKREMLSSIKKQVRGG
jgi:hypothetical protein